MCMRVGIVLLNWRSCMIFLKIMFYDWNLIWERYLLLEKDIMGIGRN